MKSSVKRLSDFKASSRVKHTACSDSFLTDTTIGEKNESLSVDLESLSLESMNYCSRFEEECSAPKCPLDVLIEKRWQVPGDPKCKIAKNTRKSYYESMPDRLKQLLPYKGLLATEFNRSRAARLRWNSMSNKERQEVIDRGRTALKKRQIER